MLLFFSISSSVWCTSCKNAFVDDGDIQIIINLSIFQKPILHKMLNICFIVCNSFSQFAVTRFSWYLHFKQVLLMRFQHLYFGNKIVRVLDFYIWNHLPETLNVSSSLKKLKGHKVIGLDLSAYAKLAVIWKINSKVLLHI